MATSDTGAQLAHDDRDVHESLQYLLGRFACGVVALVGFASLTRDASSFSQSSSLTRSGNRQCARC
jgi:hypothetical protein